MLDEYRAKTERGEMSRNRMLQFQAGTAFYAVSYCLVGGLVLMNVVMAILVEAFTEAKEQVRPFCPQMFRCQTGSGPFDPKAQIPADALRCLPTNDQLPASSSPAHFPPIFALGSGAYACLLPQVAVDKVKMAAIDLLMAPVSEPLEGLIKEWAAIEDDYSREQAIESVFQRMDVNQDRSLSLPELQEGLWSLGSEPRNQLSDEDFERYTNERAVCNRHGSLGKVGFKEMVKSLLYDYEHNQGAWAHTTINLWDGTFWDMIGANEQIKQKEGFFYTLHKACPTPPSFPHLERIPPSRPASATSHLTAHIFHAHSQFWNGDDDDDDDDPSDAVGFSAKHRRLSEIEEEEEDIIVSFPPQQIRPCVADCQSIGKALIDPSILSWSDKNCRQTAAKGSGRQGGPRDYEGWRESILDMKRSHTISHCSL